MKKTSKRLVGTLAAASTVAAIVAPAANVLAAGQVSLDFLAAKIAEAKQTKRFGNYNEAKVLIQQLPVELQAKYLAQLAELDKDVFTQLNLSFIGKLNAFALDANLGDYEALKADITASVSDPIDRGYFLGELTSWGLQKVYTENTKSAIAAVTAAWSAKTYESVQAAEAAIAKVENAKSASWLRGELLKAVATVPVGVTGVTATSNNKVSVTLDRPAIGQLRASDFSFPGLTVTDAVLGTSRDTVLLTTSSQEAGKTYAFSFRGQATNLSIVGMAKVGNEFTITSAKARSNTEVTLVLNTAPLRNLAASDFSIPGLNVLSVTVNNGVVQLETSAQVAGKTYTVTYKSSSAQFTGLAAVQETGAIKAEVLNLRQLKINFTKPIRWDSISKSNFYLRMVDEVTGDIKTNRLDKLSDENWILSEGAQSLKKSDGTANPDAMVNYVILESVDGSIMTEELPVYVQDGITILHDGLGMKYGQTIEIEARNLKDANGYINTSRDNFTAVDENAPYVSSVTNVAQLKNGAASISVKFNEPLLDNKERNGIIDGFVRPRQSILINPDFKIYIDGILVPQDRVSADLNAFIKDAPGIGKTVSEDQKVEDGKTVTIDVSGLSLGQHTIKVVGATDLNGNVMSQNPYQTTFEVKPEVFNAPPEIKKAKVTDIKQVADNALEISFDQPNVIIADPDGKAPVTIKGADWNEQWFDMESEKHPVADGKADLVDALREKAPVIEYQTDANGNTKWLVLFDAKAGRLTYEDGVLVNRGPALNYDGQQSIIRDVVVQNYATELAVDHGFKYYYGDPKTVSETFTRDSIAPVVVNQSYDVAKGIININFKDDNFNGWIDWIKNAGDIKVSRTDNNGVTYDAFLDGTDEVKVVDHNTLQLTVKNAANALGKVVNVDGSLFYNTVYTVTLPQGSVVDVQEDRGNDVGPDFLMVDMQNTTMFGGPLAPHQIKETVVSVSTKDAPPAPGTPEGLVPQTTKGLIQSGVEVRRFATAVDNHQYGADKAGSVQYMKADENLDKIIVVFDGEVLESSALNKGNYKFNGASLPQDATITFYTDEVNSNVGISATDRRDNFVIIDLPSGSVEKSGEYTFEVANVTNKSGKTMLPVADSVALVDNTRPTALSVKSVGSRQVEVTFSELVNVLNTEFARKNFEVVVNGVKLAVDDVTVGTERNKVVLTLSQDYDITNPTIQVTVKNDKDGNMYIVDDAVPANRAAQTVVTNY